MPTIDTSTSRLSQHRQRMRAEGLRSVQFWVPDTRRPDFAAALQAQCQNLKNDCLEAETLSFTEQAAATIEGWH